MPSHHLILRPTAAGAPDDHVPACTVDFRAMKYLHTMVRVTDVEASLRFYRDALGLEVLSRRDVPQGRFSLIFLAARAGGARIGVGAARVTFWGALAMLATAGIGRLFGTVVG